MDDMDEIKNIVLDIGSGSFQAGFAGDEAPQSEFPSVLGSPRFPHDQHDEISGGFVGCGAQKMKEFLSLRYPIERGIVTNWDDMEKLMAHTYEQLDAKAEKHPILFSQPPLNPRSSKENLAQLMFETFNVPALSLLDSNFLCLYACGRHSGVMVNIGDGVSFAVPHWESYCMADGIQRQDFAGRDVTHCLQNLLHERGISFTTTSEVETVRDIKERLCYTALDFEFEMNRAKKSSDMEELYKLSDGSDISIKEERIQCTEALFQPSMFGFHNFVGIQDMIVNAVQSCELDTRPNMACSIILSGRSAKFPGMTERLKVELEKRFPASLKVRVLNYPESAYSVWIGGSVLASLSAFQPISKQSYEEYGPSGFIRLSHLLS